MTLKEMLKKINTYNEVAEVIGESKLALEISDFAKGCSCRLWSFKTSDFKELKKAISDEYFKEFAEILLAYDGFEFDRDTDINESTISIRIC